MIALFMRRQHEQTFSFWVWQKNNNKDLFRATWEMLILFTNFTLSSKVSRFTWLGKTDDKFDYATLNKLVLWSGLTNEEENSFLRADPSGFFYTLNPPSSACHPLSLVVKSAKPHGPGTENINWINPQTWMKAKPTWSCGLTSCPVRCHFS